VNTLVDLSSPELSDEELAELARTIQEARDRKKKETT
jgi:hypothetical protein